MADPKYIWEEWDDPDLQREIDEEVEKYREWEKRTGGGNGQGTALGEITLKPGFMHESARAALAALIAARIPYYQRSGELVQVCRIKARAVDKSIIWVPRIVPMKLPLLRVALSACATFKAYSARGKLKRVDPPKDIIEPIFEMINEWKFDAIAGIIACPTLRPDGSILSEPGYDDATGLVLESRVSMPSIPAQPTKDNARAQLRILDELIQEYPFADQASRAVALSQLITCVVRGAMPIAPMHLIRAPASGTGKSHLMDTTAMIATGERCPVISLARQPEETEKRLLTAALSGQPIIGIDNANQQLEGSFLAQATSQTLLQIRLFGVLKKYIVQNSFCVLANGNNTSVGDEMVRRTVTCTLDAKLESPETRTFRRDPLAMIGENRGKYIAACLTIPRAFIVAGMPGRLPPTAGYKEWSDIVRSSLVWLGCADPASTIEEARDADPVRATRRLLFSVWSTIIGTESLTVGQIISRVDKWPDASFREPFLDVAKSRSDELKIDSKRLSHWLRRSRLTVADGLQLKDDLSDPSRPRWYLEEV